MRLREWLIDKLGGDEAVEGDPDALVEVAVVEMWRSELLLAALRDAGLKADAVPEQSASWTGERLIPHARLLVAASQRTEALEVIDRVISERYGPADD